MSQGLGFLSGMPGVRRLEIPGATESRPVQRYPSQENYLREVSQFLAKLGWGRGLKEDI